MHNIVRLKGLRISVVCRNHWEAIQPASDNWHFVKLRENLDGTSKQWWELDEADFYCPVAGEEHDFIVEVTDSGSGL